MDYKKARKQVKDVGKANGKMQTEIGFMVQEGRGFSFAFINDVLIGVVAEGKEKEFAEDLRAITEKHRKLADKAKRLADES